MTQRTEERLRDAIQNYTETIEPAQDGWARIHDRTLARHGRRRWKPAIAAAAAATAIAIVVAAVTFVRSDDRDGTRVHARPAGPTTTSLGPDTRPPFVSNLATVHGCIGPKQTTTTALGSVVDVPSAERAGRLASVELVFVDANGTETRRPMTRRAGNDYEATIGPYALDGNITWQVISTDEDGNTTSADGPPLAALSSC
jgi:hypothetical protein